MLQSCLRNSPSQWMNIDNSITLYVDYGIELMILIVRKLTREDMKVIKKRQRHNNVHFYLISYLFFTRLSSVFTLSKVITILDVFIISKLDRLFMTTICHVLHCSVIGDIYINQFSIVNHWYSFEP